MPADDLRPAIRIATDSTSDDKQRLLLLLCGTVEWGWLGWGLCVAGTSLFLTGTARGILCLS